MSRFDRLIAEHCPAGVTFKTLAELLEYEQPTNYLVATKDYDDSNPTPVLTPGQTFILGRTAETNGIYGASPQHPVILFDDFTTAFRWVDFPFKVKSSAVKLLRPRAGSAANFRFVYYAMQCIPFVPSEHSRHWISKYSTFRIPAPPIEVQDEVVRTLDMFAQLEAELEAELEARQRQYEHYRSAVMEFGDEVSWTTLGAATRNHDSARRPITKHMRQPGPYSYYGANGVQDHVADYLLDGTFLLVGEDGSVQQSDGSPVLNWATGKIWVNNHAHVLSERPDGPRLRFLFHYLHTVNISSLVTGSAQPKLNQASLNTIRVPLPPVEYQDRAVRMLDAFAEMLTDISSGLPAEIAARRRQYEYYRDRLLTFKELES